MFDMRDLEAAGLTPTELEALAGVAHGESPKAVSARVGMPEAAVYRLVAWALDEVEPHPESMTMADVHAAHGSRPATAAELDEFVELFGNSLPSDHEG